MHICMILKPEIHQMERASQSKNKKEKLLLMFITTVNHSTIIPYLTIVPYLFENLNLNNLDIIFDTPIYGVVFYAFRCLITCFRDVQDNGS